MISTPLIIWLTVTPPLLVVLFCRLFLRPNRFDKLAMRSARPKSYLIGILFGIGLAIPAFTVIIYELQKLMTEASFSWSDVLITLFGCFIIFIAWGTIKRRRVVIGITVAIFWCLLFAQITLYAFSDIFDQDNESKMATSVVVFLQAVLVTYYFRSRWWEFHPYPWPKLSGQEDPR